MTQYINLNSTLSNSQINQLKLGIRNSTLNLSSNMIDSSNDETNFFS